MALAYDFRNAIEKVRILTKGIVSELHSRAAEGAEQVGISVLANVQEAYRVKSRGGTGDDGIKWRDLAPATIEARLRKRHKSRAKTTAGKKKAIAKRRQKMAGLSAGAGYEIGIDTGLQINSAAPGLPNDPVWYRSGGDGLGGNLFVVEAGSVTIGYDRAYSEHFDHFASGAPNRPLLPEALPDPWQIEAEGALMTWVDLVIAEAGN